MYEKWRRFFRPEASLFIGVLFVGILGFVRPLQKDFAHVVGILTMGGGRPFHPVHLEIGKDLWGQNTIFLSAEVIPPVRGDIGVKLVGPEPLDYTVSSRYPPGVPLLNRSHPWYRFEDGELRGVHPGDDVGVVLQVKPPSAPGEYQLVMADTSTGQPYLTVPVYFERPGEGGHDEAPAASEDAGGVQGEPSTGDADDCH